MGSREHDRCNFCGRERLAVGFLIDGPRVFICDRCVAECKALLPTGDPKGSRVAYRPALGDVPAPIGGGLIAALGPHCNFCGKRPNEVRTIVEGYTTTICDECVGLCGDILDEQNERSPT
jgi:ATP-dependent protease Clp ATPase subunit